MTGASKTPLDQLKAMEPPVVVWVGCRAIARAILQVHPHRNPQNDVGWTIQELSGETYDAWARRRKRA